MSRKSPYVQAAKPEAMNPAVLAMQLAKAQEQSANPIGKLKKSPINDESDNTAQSVEDAAADAAISADNTGSETGNTIHLAAAAAPASDAPPAAAGSVPASAGAGSAGSDAVTAGTTTAGIQGTELLIYGGLIGVVAAASGGSDDGADASSTVVSGSVIGGPVVSGNGLTVNLYKADGTTLLGSDTLDPVTGQFSVDVGSYAGVVIAKVVDANTGNDYIDEATGQAVDLAANLMAVGVASGGTVTLNINPLTTLAALKSGANFAGATTGTPTTDAVNQTNTAVASAFGLSDLTGTTVVTTVSDNGSANNAYNPADGLTNAEKYGAVLAALSGMDSNVGGSQTTINTLVANLTVAGSSGTLSLTALDAMMSGSATADGNTSGNLLNIISDAIAKSSASISINTIAGDNAINAAEAGAALSISGTNVAGASVALSIGGNTRDATVTGTTWSYSLVAGDFTAMGQGSETITATSTLTTGTGASATTTTTTASRTLSIDTQAPTLVITSNDAALKSGETATVSFTFNEAPSGFAAGDITTTGGTLSGLALSADPKVYTATFTPTPNTASGNASITVAAGTYTDAAGNNGGAGTTPAISIDTLVPTLSISSNVSAVKSGETATITFTFSEAPIGFAAGDITTTGGSLSAPTVTADPKVYTATFTPTPGTASGNASITVAAGAYADAAGNNGGAGTTPAISIDTLAPTLTITSNDPALKGGETATISFTFSEAPTGFAAGDVTTTGGNLSAPTVTADPKVYTATFTPTPNTASGNASITVAADAFTDAAGNSGGAGATPAISIDTLAPSVTINAITGDNVINASEHSGVVSISGTSSGVENGQTVTVGLNNRTYTGTVSGDAWSVSVNATDVGALADLTSYTVTANVSDLAGNPAAQATQSVLIAVSGPVINIGTIAGDNFISSAEHNSAATIGGTVSGAEGRTVTVHMNGQTYTGTVTGGAWSVTVDAATIGALADATYPVTADVSDSTGNAAQQASRNLIVDTTLATPTVALAHDNGTSTSDALTNDASLGLSVAAGDVSRTYAVDGAAASATYTAPTTDGSHTVVVTDTDTAGNTANASLTFTLDKTLATPTLALANDTGSSNSDRITSNAGSLTTSATAADVTRTFTVDGAAASASYTAPTTDGSHTVVVTDTDTAGNTTNASLTFTRDTSAPTVAVTGVDISADSGASASDFNTNTAAQTISGTLSTALTAGDVLEGSVDNGAHWTAITSMVNGTAINWTGATLAGSDTIGFRVTDVAGNTGSTTGTQAYTLDTTAPVFSSGASAIFPNQGTGTVYTAAASDASAVSYSLVGTDAAAFNIDANTGAVTFKTAPNTATPTDAGANNVYDISVVASDLAGNPTSHAVAVSVVNAPSLQANVLDNVTNFEVTSNIVLNYSENIAAVAGKFIHLVNDGGTGFHGETAVHTQDILVTDAAQVTITGNSVTLNPTFDLDLANNYHIEIDAGAFTGTSSQLATAAFDGTSSLNFGTVTPGASSLTNAVQSQAMNASGALENGHQWLDMEGIGSASSASGAVQDLSTANYALVAKDYDATGANAIAGFDGIVAGDFYVGANNFGAGDLIYIDDQANNTSASNDLVLSSIVNFGQAPTLLQFPGSSTSGATTSGGLGGLIDLTLAGSTSGYDSISAIQTALLLATPPIISA